MAEAEQFRVETFMASDGYRLHYRRYVPDGKKAEARVIFLHGIQSHAGWYAHSCERLRQEGFLVDFLDRRGSGMNTHLRGDAPSYQRLIEDVNEFVEKTKGDARPPYLGGISWGGKLVMGLLRSYRNQASGVILICPGFFAKMHPRIGERLSIGMARLFQPRRFFPIPLNDPALFTESPEGQEFIRKDKASIHQATARLLVESVRLDRLIEDAARHIHVPVLLLLAQHDRIIDNFATRAYVERFATIDRTIIEYQKAHHTLEFEPDAETFIQDIVSWLRRQQGKLLGLSSSS